MKHERIAPKTGAYRLGCTAALLLGLVGCAGARPSPARPPAGATWRTLHQGYIFHSIVSTASSSRNTTTVTTATLHEDKVVSNELGPREVPRLVRGATVTWARLEGVAP